MTMRSTIYFFFSAMMVLLIVVCGCSRKGHTTATTTEVTDSTHTKEIVRYVEVMIPGETVTIEKLIECDSVTNKPRPFTIEKNSGRAGLTLIVDSSGRLTGTGECDSLKRLVEARDKEILRLKSKTKTEVKTETVYKTRGIDKFCRVFTAVVLFILIGYVFYKLKFFQP